MKILIIDKVHPLLIDELIRNKCEVDYLPEITYEETEKIIHIYNGIVVRSKFTIDEALMSKAVNLKFVARAGVGLDIFDLAYANKNNIKVLNAAGANANAVAEHALGLLLGLTSNITKSNNQVKEFIWKREENRAAELRGKTIGLIGYGNTGRAFAEKLKKFDCIILANDKFKTDFSDQYVTESSLEEIKNKADIVSLHIPLTEETLFMCNDKFFNSFEKEILFINTARGKIVDTQDLLAALENKKIKGAGLDVLENENFDDLPEITKETYKKLFACTNVIVTPHIAGWSFQSFENISEALVESILQLTD